MKILYHHRTMAVDGQEIHIRALLRAFSAEGAEVREVALVQKGSADPSRTLVGSNRSNFARVTQLHPAVRELAEYLYIPIGRHKLLRANRGFGADFIYERYAFGNAAGVFAARRLGIPLVLEVNSPLCQELGETRGVYLPAVAKRIERFVFRSADLIIVVSQELAKVLVESGVDRDRLLVMPNGVFLEDFNCQPALATRQEARTALGLATATGIDMPVVAGFVGYYRRWHRLDLLIRGMAMEGLEDLQVVLVGGGETATEIESLAKELGVTNRLHMVEAKPAEEIPKLLAAFDIGVLPGIPHYASPLKLIEYMAAGLSVVAPDQDNIRELLKHRTSCLLFNPEDECSLGSAIAKLVHDAKFRQSLGMAARRTVEERCLSWRENARRVLAHVTQLTAG
ncbi:MAG: glycosyltransferase family 4 protein [bacterium]|nr:glycosyltransferase family 4 protein [bacterium]